MMNKILPLILKGVFGFLTVVLLAVLWRVFVADRFVIPTRSMEPTLEAGDRILVDKTILGARIYKDYDFHKGMELKCWRTKGFRGLERGEVVVFNFPRNGDGAGDGISFTINYVFAKRCIGLPGDSISVVDGYWLNNNYPGILGIKECQDKLSATPLEMISPEVNNVIRPAGSDWTVKDFGPVYVPKKGDKIEVNDTTQDLYGVIFRYEKADSDAACHTFTHDYYYMAGDNVCDSGDSRYWGFVPEDYIVGIVKAVLFNRDRQTGKRNFKKFRLL
jgi:signal peptidase I